MSGDLLPPALLNLNYALALHALSAALCSAGASQSTLTTHIQRSRGHNYTPLIRSARDRVSASHVLSYSLLFLPPSLMSSTNSEVVLMVQFDIHAEYRDEVRTAAHNASHSRVSPLSLSLFASHTRGCWLLSAAVSAACCAANQFLRDLGALAQHTRDNEPHTLAYQIYVDHSDPNVIYIYERSATSANRSSTASHLPQHTRSSVTAIC